MYRGKTLQQVRVAVCKITQMDMTSYLLSSSQELSKGLFFRLAYSYLLSYLSINIEMKTMRKNLICVTSTWVDTFYPKL